MTGSASSPLPSAEIGLDTPIGELEGVVRSRAALLARHGIRTVEDLLWRLPLRHEDRSRTVTIRDLQAGVPATVRVEVERARLARTRRRGFTILEARVRDATGPLDVTFFNQPYLLDVLLPGTQVRLHGTPEASRLFLELKNPEVEVVAAEQEQALHTGRIVPVYERMGSFAPRAHRALVARVLAGLAGRIDEILPEAVLAAERLPGREEAFRQAHFPDPPGDGARTGRDRLAFEELFVFQLALALRRARTVARGGATPLVADGALRQRLRRMLPFRLTAGQRRVLQELAQDLRRERPMQRLLQGDVGSGKTIVAGLVLALAAGCGGQAAMMAPTELLAEQHARTLGPLFERAGLRWAIVTGGGSRRQREAVAAAIRSGEVPIAIGTHALLEGGVEFRRLVLAVIDEQHRFGVVQRDRLGEKGRAAHVLVMTATPIPRSLALTAYGDLDLSVLDERPPGRRPVRTVIKRGSNEDEAYRFLRREVESGAQAYVICPLVEGNEAGDLKAATEWAEYAAKRWLGGVSSALVHGRTPAADRRRVMRAFADGEVQVLFGTTVLEVGVDVPRATVMLVEHAERFGLSQLHQLRGRIGRGGSSSTCILLVRGKATRTARARLETLRRSDSGFEIAEADLALRGPGELGGTRQWGLPEFRVAHIVRDFRLLERARAHAARHAADPAFLDNPASAELLRRARPWLKEA